MRAFSLLFTKSRVKQHTRTRNGKVETVKEYTDKRTKKPDTTNIQSHSDEALHTKFEQIDDKVRSRYNQYGEAHPSHRKAEAELDEVRKELNRRTGGDVKWKDSDEFVIPTTTGQFKTLSDSELNKRMEQLSSDSYDARHKYGEHSKKFYEALQLYSEAKHEVQSRETSGQSKNGNGAVQMDKTGKVTQKDKPESEFEKKGHEVYGAKHLKKWQIETLEEGLNEDQLPAALVAIAPTMTPTDGEFKKLQEAQESEDPEVVMAVIDKMIGDRKKRKDPWLPTDEELKETEKKATSGSWKKNKTTKAFRMRFGKAVPGTKGKPKSKDGAMKPSPDMDHSGDDDESAQDSSETAKKVAAISKVTGVDRHRNGEDGEPFDIVSFQYENPSTGDVHQMIGIVFDEPGHVAVFDATMLGEGKTSFGGNSWRGDRFEEALRAAVESHEKDLYGHLGPQEDEGDDFEEEFNNAKDQS